MWFILHPVYHILYYIMIVIIIRYIILYSVVSVRVQMCARTRIIIKMYTTVLLYNNNIYTMYTLALNKKNTRKIRVKIIITRIFTCRVVYIIIIISIFCRFIRHPLVAGSLFLFATRLSPKITKRVSATLVGNGRIDRFADV